MANKDIKNARAALVAKIIRRWPRDEAREWVQAFASKACTNPSVLAVVAFGAAMRTTCFTADVDLLVIYQSPKPAVNGRPIDVDIRWYERSRAEALVKEGQELLGWVVRFGALICEHDGYWRKLRQEWLGKMPFPSAEVADQRVQRAWRLYHQLCDMGDEDAAQEQHLAGLTQQARALLIRKSVYPASRPELPSQLRAIGETELAEKLQVALKEREEGTASDKGVRLIN